MNTERLMVNNRDTPQISAFDYGWSQGRRKASRQNLLFPLFHIQQKHSLSAYRFPYLWECTDPQPSLLVSECHTELSQPPSHPSYLPKHESLVTTNVTDRLRKKIRSLQQKQMNELRNCHEEELQSIIIPISDRRALNHIKKKVERTELEGPETQFC